jgi:hypothetical protein
MTPERRMALLIITRLMKEEKITAEEACALIEAVSQYQPVPFLTKSVSGDWHLPFPSAGGP